MIIGIQHPYGEIICIHIWPKHTGTRLSSVLQLFQKRIVKKNGLNMNWNLYKKENSKEKYIGFHCYLKRLKYQDFLKHEEGFMLISIN